MAGVRLTRGTRQQADRQMRIMWSQNRINEVLIPQGAAMRAMGIAGGGCRGGGDGIPGHPVGADTYYGTTVPVRANGRVHSV